MSTLVLFLTYSQVNFLKYFGGFMMRIIIIQVATCVNQWENKFAPYPALSVLILNLAFCKSYLELFYWILIMILVILTSSNSKDFLAKKTFTRIGKYFLWVVIWTISVEEHVNSQVFFDLLNIELVHQSWLLCRELQSFAEDFKKGLKTAAIALGRYDCYRVFALLQVIVFALVAVDILAVCLKKSIILLLLPFTALFIFKIRNMKMENFPSLYFIFFALFTGIQTGTFLIC